MIAQTKPSPRAAAAAPAVRERRPAAIQAVRGMNDVLPDAAGLWEHFEDAAREVFGQYGYRNLRVPVVEATPLFVRAIGAESYPVVRHAVLSPDECVIAHVPVRSATQFSAKIAVGWLSCLVQPGRAEQLSYHWRDAFALLSSGRQLTPELLTAIAANYGAAGMAGVESTAAEQVDDPFLAEFSNRHGGVGRTDALALVLRYAERLARQIGGKDASGAKLPAG